MALLFMVALVIALGILVRRRERRYLESDLKNVISEDAKKYLNIPTEDATFPKTPLPQQASEQGRSKPSRKILEDLNQN